LLHSTGTIRGVSINGKANWGLLSLLFKSVQAREDDA
jgi:hypothetical protein